MKKLPVIRPLQSLILLSLIAASGILAHAQTPAQTPTQTPVQPPATKPPAPAAAKPLVPDGPLASDNKHYTSKDLSVRPYSPAIPAPLYPSSQRKQSQFTVQYVFNYATSNYTPPVPLALVSRAAARHDSPEAALTAYYSAMRSGDYEAWLQCWDEPSRKALEATTKQQKMVPSTGVPSGAPPSPTSATSSSIASRPSTTSFSTPASKTPPSQPPPRPIQRSSSSTAASGPSPTPSQTTVSS